MLNIKDINYKKLSSDERFKLAVAAFSRGDDTEITRLKRTCPTKNYTMIDCEYTNRIAGLTWVITQFSEICEYSYHQIILCESCITCTLSLLNTETIMHKNLFTYVQPFQIAKDKHISNLRSAYQALIEFCKDNQISEANVFQWIAITPEMSYSYDSYLNNNIPINQEFMEYAKEKFYSIWKSYVYST